MHPDLEGYVWITVKAFGVALLGVYALRIGRHVYQAMLWGI